MDGPVDTTRGHLQQSIQQLDAWMSGHPDSLTKTAEIAAVCFCFCFCPWFWKSKWRLGNLATNRLGLLLCAQLSTPGRSVIPSVVLSLQKRCLDS